MKSLLSSLLQKVLRCSSPLLRRGLGGGLLLASTTVSAQSIIPIADSLYNAEEYTQLLNIGKALTFQEEEKVMYLKTLALRELLRYDEAMKEAVALKTYYPDNKAADLQQLAIATQLQRYGFVSSTAISLATRQKQPAAIYVYGLQAANKINQAYEYHQLSAWFYEHYPTDARAVLSYASALQKLKQYDSSLSVLMPALNNAPFNAALAEKALKAFYLLGKYEEATTWGKELVAQQQYLPNAMIYYAQSLYYLQRHHEVITLVKTLESQDEGNDQLLLIGARAARESKQYAQSNEWLQRGKSNNLPSISLDYLHELAQNELLQGRPTQAQKFYDTAWYIYGAPYTLYLKGIAAQQTANTALATKYFEAYKQHPLVRSDTGADNRRILEYIKQSSR